MFSNFLPREDIINRNPNSQPRFLCPSTSHTLNIIMEEDESRTASSRSSSPLLSVKARRRHANIATIKINRDSDLNDFDNTFLSPRPAPRPDSSSSTPQSSPDSLKLAFTDLSKFPCPPSAFNLFTPTLSTSDLSSSPGAHSSCVLTPSTSDDEFSLPSPRFDPRRAAMQPLVMSKNAFDRIPPCLRPSKKSPPSFMALADNDSDPESDSEWYNHEFSQLISLRSPVSSSFPFQQASRPDSMSIPSDLVFSPTPPSKRRVSGSFSSKANSSDTIYPRRRISKTRSVMIPKYPPPPVPPVPEHLRLPSITAASPSSSPCRKAMPLDVPRPPPRSSIPADCVFDLYLDGEEGDAESDGSSDFSFTMYEIDFGERVPGLPESPASVYSQPSLESQQELPLDDVKFELDYQLMLPLSIPGSPIDLEADIAMGFEKLREQVADVEQTLPVVDEKKEEAAAPSECPKEAPPQHHIHHTHTPTISSFSFSPSPSPASFTNQHTGIGSPSSHNEERVLRSKWSSSTLGSVHDEHGHNGSRSASARLRLYFGGGGGGGHSTKRTSKNHSSSIPRTPPQSPFALKSPSSSSSSSKKAKTYYSPSLSPSPLTRWPPAHRRGSSANNNNNNNNNSDVIVIGYGVNGAGLKRRGSTATVSDVGSEDSASSTSSSGLRRKPIPIEMFLRNAA